jgi:hypothetical protein
MNGDAQGSGVDVVRKFGDGHPATRDRGLAEIDFNLANSEGVKIYSRRDRDGECKFLVRDTVPPYVDNRPLLAAGKPELREYKAVFVVGDQEVSQFSDEITVNCAPLV